MLEKFKIGIRINLLIVTGFIMLISLGLFALINIENNMMQDRRTKTRNLVEVAYGIIQYYGSMVESGKVSKEEGLSQALSILKALRYEKDDYFWVNDLEPRMLMHPFKPALDGKYIGDYADPNGKHLFVEMVRIGREKGGGYVDYHWPKPGHDDPVEKISYIKLYRPWGIMVGSGIYVDDVKEEFNKKAIIIGISILIALIILALTGFNINRSILKPLKKTVEVTNSIRNGDFTVRISKTGKDEISLLLDAQSKMAETLAAVTQKVKEQAGSIANASEQISQGALTLSDNANIHATGTEEAKAIIQEFLRFFMENLNGARETERIALSAYENAEEGIRYVKDALEAIQKITEKISIVEELANQTNLLALNATIEAARAGVHGRGFSVVASEVNRLAESSRASAGEINKVAKESLEIGGQASNAIHRILPSVKETANFVRKIVAATENQTESIKQMSKIIEQLDDATQGNAASSEELASISSEMSSQSLDLQNIVSFFRTNTEE